MAKAARIRKRKRDGMIGEWNFVGSGHAKYILDTHFGAGDIITINDVSDSNRMNIKVSDIPKLKNPKRIHPARKRKAKQMMRPIKSEAQYISIDGGSVQVEKISETQWIILGTDIS
jgi:hypothetical protein